MSQRAGSLSYLVFSTGFSFAVYALFHAGGWRVALFDDLGKNALAAYVIHGMVDDVVKPFAPRDSPLWWMLAAFAVFFLLTWRIVRYLNSHGLYLRL
jgi:fucose 4-O-acetylase-like acetyltransferase